MLYITHFMEEAVRADRVVVMHNGKVAMTGAPVEVFSQVKRLKTIGLDVPQVTELAYNLQQKGLPINPALLTVEEMVMALCQ